MLPSDKDNTALATNMARVWLLSKDILMTTLVKQSVSSSSALKVVILLCFIISVWP